MLCKCWSSHAVHSLGQARVPSTGRAQSLISGMMTWSAPADLAMAGARQVLQPRQSIIYMHTFGKPEVLVGEVQTLLCRGAVHGEGCVALAARSKQHHPVFTGTSTTHFGSTHRTGQRSCFRYSNSCAAGSDDFHACMLGRSLQQGWTGCNRECCMSAARN